MFYKPAEKNQLCRMGSTFPKSYRVVSKTLLK